MYSLSQEVLRTDVSGMPLEWIDYRDAVRLHFMGQIAYACGQSLFLLRGGVNARSGRRTTVEVNSIVATLDCSFRSSIPCRVARVTSNPANMAPARPRDSR